MLNASDLKVMLRSWLANVGMIKVKSQHHTATAASVDVTEDPLCIKCVAKVQSGIRCPDAHGNAVVSNDEAIVRFIDLAGDIDRKGIAKILRCLGWHEAQWISRGDHKVPVRRRFLLVSLARLRTGTLSFKVAYRIQDGPASFLIKETVEP